ncbi:12997_t:CDS:2 [Entrophospora sp. SA101]|nr:12997_t:CDS:2 [Entrophospora sp. SA101]CAJ0926010.1 19390_t:CDS:2 [Entrophospora sp. SA101]CAJ0926038.1 7301_t:CDS:2 [Entrophospora sp. SA101]
MVPSLLSNNNNSQELVTEESPLLVEDDHSPQSPPSTTPDKKFSLTYIIDSLRKPHALWMLPFSFILSVIISSTIAPLEYYDTNNSTITINNGDDDPDVRNCRIHEVQSMASTYLMIYQMSLFIADYKGRIFIFRISIFGTIFAFLIIILVGNYWRIIGIKLMFIGAIVEGLCGGIIAINTACHAYTSDCISPENRSLSFGLMNALAFGGMTVGPTLGGLIIKSLSSESRRNNQQGQGQHHYHQNSLLSIGRMALYVLGIIYFIYRLSQAGQNEIIALYTTYKFHWTPLENGFFYSLQSFTRFIALLVFLPLCKFINSKFISSHYNNNNIDNNTTNLDLWLMRFGLVMESIGFMVFALADLPEIFYLGCIFTSVSTIISPTIRSICISFVSPTKTGQILGGLSLLEGIGSILSPLWMNSLYSWSVKNEFPEIVFWSNSGLFIVAAFLGLLVWQYSCSLTIHNVPFVPFSNLAGYTMS